MRVLCLGHLLQISIVWGILNVSYLLSCKDWIKLDNPRPSYSNLTHSTWPSSAILYSYLRCKCIWIIPHVSGPHFLHTRRQQIWWRYHGGSDMPLKRNWNKCPLVAKFYFRLQHWHQLSFGDLRKCHHVKCQPNLTCYSNLTNSTLLPSAI